MERESHCRWLLPANRLHNCGKILRCQTIRPALNLLFAALENLVVELLNGPKRFGDTCP